MRIIAGMTWKELLRKKVMLLTLLLTVVFLLAFWFVAQTIGKNDVFDGNGMISFSTMIARFTNGAFILMLGFFFGSFVIAFLAIFSSFSAVSGEAEQGIMQAMLPRPLPRWKWYFGRWLGYVSLGVIYAGVLFASILLITRYHAAIPQNPAALLRAFLLFVSTVPLLVSLAMLGSGIFSALGNGVLMTMLYGAGWLGGMLDKLSGSLRLEPDGLVMLHNLTGLISMAMPADSLQRRMTTELLSIKELSGIVDITSGSFSMLSGGTGPSDTFIIYAIGYTLVALLIGLYRFQRRDL
ncbi:ABC transporter permease subunit [Paenibacillus typhae]|uniref:ABC-2 family transporter protein n=1 Tax=Paenibacillus typhae TaxID=1174501 RepID=A0A1G8UPU9_9BACL|nr:ABC transporter permease subunit [Paenibacillus typhae]SDJ55862.1 ABC-2 family transporter protein [Paenibacillus typhae]